MRIIASSLLMLTLVSCASLPGAGSGGNSDGGPAEDAEMASLPSPPSADEEAIQTTGAPGESDSTIGKKPEIAAEPFGDLSPKELNEQSFPEASVSAQPAPGELPGAYCDAMNSESPVIFPVITSIDPKKFNATGGKILTIVGDAFEVGAKVFIGSMECVDVAVQDMQTITCTVPPYAGGSLGIVVANPRRQCVAAEETVKYVPLVDIAPRTRALVVKGTQVFTASGGTAPYRYSVTNGSGFVDGSTGVYTAPAQPTTAMVRVTDAEGITSEAVVIAQPELEVSLKEGGEKDDFTFNVTGGAPPLHYTIEPKETGSDEAGNSVGSSLVTVTDGTGASKSVTLKIHRGLPLSLFPQFPQTAPAVQSYVIATGGNGGYFFAVTSGAGTVDPQTGKFTAPNEAGTTGVRVTDSKGLSMDTSINTVPVAVAEKGIYPLGIAAGNGHTCWTGKGGLKCWGDNRHGELGNGTMVRQGHPTDVKGITHDALQIVSGYNHSCALLVGGRMKCWGDNRYGQLGDGTQVNSITPVQVSGMLGGVIQIAAGQYHSCAIIRGGSVKCWGSNRRGQLGDDQVKPSPLPVQVKGLEKGVLHLAAGAAHTCAVVEGGGVKCWGYNNTGQLGDGTLTDRLTATEVSGLSSGVNAVALGGFHSCAVLSSGVKCWGNNGLGQLGNSTLANAQVPKDVMPLGGNVRLLSAGFYHTCALLDGVGGVRCWGYNREGQLGDGSDSVRQMLPVSVKNLGSDVQAIAAGVDHTCALVDQGVRCWGGNSLGQFGNRSQLGSRTPSRVVSLETEISL